MLFTENEQLTPEVAAVAKVKCLKSLLFHTRLLFKSKEKRKFIVNSHHEIICAALERVLSGKCKRLLLAVAPRYTKTELAVKQLISNGLALNPAAKFIHLSYGDDIALDNSEHVKDTVQTPLYQQLFPNVIVKKDSKAKDKWYTTKGGGVLARSAAGQVTGFGAGQVDPEAEQKEIDAINAEFDEFTPEVHTDTEDDLDAKFLFSGAVIIDDPIKPEDADQDTIRVKVNNRFDSTIRNRVNSRNTPIIVIMQRLHPEDLIGYLLRADESDKWEYICLPCINQEGNAYGLEPGEALWPHKHTVDELLRMKKANDIVFERQYMQNPKPKEGLLFPEDELNYFDIASMIDQLEDADHVYIPVDPANLGGDDFAAPVLKLIGNKIYVTDLLYNTEGADHNEPLVVSMVISHKANACGIEGVFGWAESVKRIREALERKNYEGEIRQLRPRTAKHVRIVSKSAFIRNHFVFRKDYATMPQYDKFMRNLCSYRKIQEEGKKNKHDEAPDVCEMGAGYFEKQFPELWELL